MFFIENGCADYSAKFPFKCIEYSKTLNADCTLQTGVAGRMGQREDKDGGKQTSPWPPHSALVSFCFSYMSLLALNNHF